MNIISFNIGMLYQWTESNNPASVLKFVRKLDVNGVEIGLGYRDEIHDLKLSKADIRYLRELKYNTIHAPFRLLREKKSDKEVEEILSIIEGVYKSINAKSVVIHPTEIPEPEVLRNYDMNIITENMPHAYKEYRNINFGKIFRKYPKIGLCLDTAHSFRNSKDETRILVKKYKDKIKQIHFSVSKRGTDHLTLKAATEAFMKSVEPLRNLKVPIVMEEAFEKGDINSIMEEIKLIKKLFFQ